VSLNNLPLSFHPHPQFRARQYGKHIDHGGDDARFLQEFGTSSSKIFGVSASKTDNHSGHNLACRGDE